MIKQPRNVTGSVLKLRCTTCDSTFPHFRFSGEGDAATVGLCSITSCKKNELIIAEVEPGEWNAFDREGSEQFEKRLRGELHREDLRLVRLIRTIRKSVSCTRPDFRDFMKTYNPSEEIFSCPCCATGESEIVEEVTIENFVRSGGSVVATGRLVQY